MHPEAELAQMLSHGYAYARDFFQQGRLDEAEGFFRYLCMYDFSNPGYALGLAATYQLKKQYAQAIDVYRMVRMLDGGGMRPMFFQGQCHFMLRQFESARRCFEACLSCDDAGSLHISALRYLAMIGRTGDASFVPCNGDHFSTKSHKW